MTTIKMMRRELLTANSQGYAEDVRNLSGIEGSPRDASEVFILYLALEATRGSDQAYKACEAVKKYYEELQDL